MVYDFLNNPFTYGFGIPALNLTPITFYDIPHPHKRTCYNLDLLPAANFFSSENSFITLTTPYYLQYILLSNYTNTLHVMNKYVPLLGSVKKGYLCKKHY